ncbi:hypothetical protein CRUP_015686, partial [Coryphaenoides rupestris]
MTTVLHIDLFHHLLLACLASSTLAFSSAFIPNVIISPLSPVVEIGRNFTATCSLVNIRDASLDDLV